MYVEGRAVSARSFYRTFNLPKPRVPDLTSEKIKIKGSAEVQTLVTIGGAGWYFSFYHGGEDYGRLRHMGDTSEPKIYDSGYFLDDFTNFMTFIIKY